MLRCIAGSHRHKGGRKPGNGDNVDRTYSMEEAGYCKGSLLTMSIETGHY